MGPGVGVLLERQDLFEVCGGAVVLAGLRHSWPSPTARVEHFGVDLRTGQNAGEFLSRRRQRWPGRRAGRMRLRRVPLDGAGCRGVRRGLASRFGFFAFSVIVSSVTRFADGRGRRPALGRLAFRCRTPRRRPRTRRRGAGRTRGYIDHPPLLLDGVVVRRDPRTAGQALQVGRFRRVDQVDELPEREREA